MFCTVSFSNISYSKKNPARWYRVYAQVYMYRTHCTCQILMKHEFSLQMFEKSSNMKFNEKPSRGEPSCSMRTNRQTDKHDEVHGLFP